MLIQVRNHKLILLKCLHDAWIPTSRSRKASHKQCRPMKSPQLLHSVNIFLSWRKVNFAHIVSLHHWILMKAYIHSIGQTALQATFTIHVVSNVFKVHNSYKSQQLVGLEYRTQFLGLPRLLRLTQPLSHAPLKILRLQTNLKVTKADGTSTVGCVVVC